MNLTIRKEKVTFSETKIFGIIPYTYKFWVEADVPESLLEDFDKISSFIGKEQDTESQKKVFIAMKKIISGILIKNNSKYLVNKFVKKLGIIGAQKVFTFLSEYINTVSEEKKNS